MSELTVSHRYPFAAERVFDAWLDPKVAGRFLFATPDGEMVRAETDPRVGGRFTFVDRRPEMGDVEHVGEYLEIDRPRRLVFTFAVPQYDPGDTTVTLDFRPDGDGCVVTLSHAGVLEEWAKQTVQGWTTILEGLERVLG
jgi:uncharacterized protein YndB with AHSA1/START domain